MAASGLKWSTEHGALDTADTDSLQSSIKTSSSSLLSASMRSRAWVRRTSQERRISKDKSVKSDSKLTPFYLRWSFGNNKSTPVYNLTRFNRPLIFYSSCHAGVLYDYRAKEMRLLQGHHNPVSAIATDNTGKWVVTADVGVDNVVIVWDSELCIPVSTLFSPHPEVGTKTVAISPDAKYLVTVSDGTKPSIALWLWTLGKETPDAVVKMSDDFGVVCHIVFNPLVSHEFMVTSEEKVAFFTWSSEDVELKCYEPEFNKPKIGQYTESVYLPELYQALTCTNKGFVLWWGPINASLMTSIKKRLLKQIRLQKDGITCIRSVFTSNVKESDETECKRVVVTGNSHGHIRFYDERLRILYWCQKFTLDAIVSIDFHLQPRQYQLKDPLDVESMSTFHNSKSSNCSRPTTAPTSPPRAGGGSPSTNNSGPTSPRIMHMLHEDWSQEFEIIYANMIPSDASLQRRPFVVRDFVVSTATGQIGLVNFLDNELNMMLYSGESNVSAIEVHPERPYLVMANELGHLRIYNYQSKELLVENQLPTEHTTDTAHIRSLQFAPSGLYLVCGLIDGSLWVLDPNLLQPFFTPPCRRVRSSIKKIAISPDSEYIAHIDNNMCTCLYRTPDQSGKELVFLGKQRAHYKEVRDILFGDPLTTDEDVPRLFTLGEDRVLIEYDVANSTSNELAILNMERVEQSAVPLCMAWYPMFTVERFLITANTEYKYKILNDSTKMCRKTALTSLFDSPVSQIKILGSLKTPDHNRTYMVFATDKQIGIQMLPADGNPYKSLGMIGHPDKIFQICTSPEDKYLFTIGGDDSNILMWQINSRAVDVMTRIGGEGVTPYYCLIEGGQTGWLFQEMQDFFYYAQILHQGESLATTRKVSDKIPLCELPDLMRAIGFYPSEYEIENMVHEVHYSHFAETGVEEEHVNFEEFVRLYINHHPSHGISGKALQKAFDTFADIPDSENAITTRDTFLSALQERGECFSSEQAVKYMSLLAQKETRKPSTIKESEGTRESESHDSAFQRIPEDFSYKVFIEEILGITYTTPDLRTGAAIKFNSHKHVE